MTAVTPFLVRESVTGTQVIVIGFTNEPTPRALCVGKAVALIRLEHLEVLEAARDWPRPVGDDLAIDRVFGESVLRFTNFGDTPR